MTDMMIPKNVSNVGEMMLHPLSESLMNNEAITGMRNRIPSIKNVLLRLFARFFEKTS